MREKAQFLNQAPIDTEDKIDSLKNELHNLNSAYSEVIQAPPLEWIEKRLNYVQSLLEKNVAHSATILRKLLDPIELEPVFPDTGKPHYVAHTKFNAIEFLDKSMAPTNSDKGANQLHWWTWSQCVRTMSILQFEIIRLNPVDQLLFNSDVSTRSQLRKFYYQPATQQ